MKSTGASPQKESSRDLHLLDPLIVIARGKWFIFVVTSAAAALSVLYALLAPPIYTSTVKILPPQQNQSIAASLAGQLGGLANLAGRDIGIRNPNDTYLAMLHSRLVADALIRRFGLQQLYRQKNLTYTRERLELATQIQSGKDGVISIAVEDSDAQRAAELANGYVEELRQLNQKIAVTEAGQRRSFFQTQLEKAKEDLANAELELRKTQEATGVIQIEGQAKAAIEATAKARAQIAAKEVQLRALRGFATDRNPEVMQLQEEIAGLQSQLGRLEQDEGRRYEVPVGKMPAAGLEYVRRLREVKYQETIFELLARQYEVAKIDEAKEGAVVQVLDPAAVPEIRTRPRRTLIVLFSTVMGFMGAVLVTLVKEAVAYAVTLPETRERLALLKAYLRAGPGAQ
jgi:tyrosine-protein kinase Etk/Wzc